MPLIIKHGFSSNIVDDPRAASAGEILPSHWNANHILNGTADASQLNANVVQSVVNDTNITGLISSQVLSLGFTGTLAAARLNANVVQAVTNDTNITGLISSQNLTFGWAGQLSIPRGGTGQATASASFDALSPTTTRGDLIERGASSNVRLSLGTSGYALISNGIDPAWTGFTQVGTGAATRTWQSKATDFISVTDFTGVDPTGVSDSTVGIAAAIAATPAGGALYFPAGAYLVSGSGSAIFTITKPINIIGSGMNEGTGGTTFIITAAVPTTRDIFSIVGVINTTTVGYTFRNFNVAAQGSNGKNVFHFDSTAGTTTNFAKVTIDNVFLDPNASAGGYSIVFDNGIGTNTNGGVYDSTINNCYLGGGFNSLQTGDSIRLYNNLIHTANAAIIVNQVGGAGGFVISGNNVSGTGGGVIISQAVAPYIGPANEFEQQATNTEANNSIIDITGSGANVSSPKIIGNLVQANASTGNPTLIRIASATGAVIDGNRLGTPAAYAHIINTAAAVGTVIGLGNTFAGGGANITDSGSNTINGPAGAEIVGGTLTAANFNSTADQSITISSPSTRYMISAIIVSNPSIALTTAAGGFYSAASKGGVTIVAATQVYSGLSNIVNNPGSALLTTLAAGGTTSMWNLSTIFLSLTTAQGSAATADVTVMIRQLP